MEVKTKFNIGDIVYTIEPKKMKIKEVKIASVTVFCYTSETVVKIYDEVGDGYYEEKCFSSEKELLTYITEKEK